jgi:hypothetical protein
VDDGVEATFVKLRKTIAMDRVNGPPVPYVGHSQACKWLPQTRSWSVSLPPHSPIGVLLWYCLLKFFEQLNEQISSKSSMDGIDLSA